MLLTDNDQTVTLVRCKFVVSRHTLLPESHPHRLLPAITRGLGGDPLIGQLLIGLGGHLLTRRLARVLSLGPRVVGEDVLTLLK